MKKNITMSPLSVNGLDGRQLYIENLDSKRDIMLVYGHHASLERMQSFADYLSRYGSITICDLPGFGGMDSFYKIGMNASLDNYADYLAAVIRLRYKQKKITLVGTSFSFLVVTRMLQKHPKLVKQIELLISLVGFTHHEDIRLKKTYIAGLKTVSALCDNSVGAAIFRYMFLNSLVIKTTYRIFAKKNPKMKTAETTLQLNQRISADIKLWQINDVRTRFVTMAQIFSVDLCQHNINKQIDKKVHHIYVADDVYVDQYLVEQHMSIIYSGYEAHKSPMEAHMPSIIADADEAGALVPDSIKRLLS